MFELCEHVTKIGRQRAGPARERVVNTGSNKSNEK